MENQDRMIVNLQGVVAGVTVHQFWGRRSKRLITALKLNLEPGRADADPVNISIEAAEELIRLLRQAIEAARQAERAAQSV